MTVGDTLYATVCQTKLAKRKKCFLILTALLTTIVLIVVQYLHPQSLSLGDAYMDDVPEELYKEVFLRWYNLSEGEKWFNGKNVSAWDPELLREIHENWIIRRYNPSEPYFLYSPEVEDPSMGQATVIREIFRNKRDGFFIECGAFDGETRSNTLNLERYYGWSGILIEADPINFTKMLRKNRKAILSPTCLSVQPRPMEASFLMARNIGRLHVPDGNSTAAKLKHGPDVAHYGTHVIVQCFPLAAYVVALAARTVDYFSLDVEGNEIDVLETIPFHLLDIKTLSVEYIHDKKDRNYMIDLMDERGYYVHSFVKQPDNLANDIIFAKRDL